MALLTDDCDINKFWLTTYLGGNGDYYICIISEDEQGIKSSKEVRVSTSGGNAPTSVKIAVAELYRAMDNEELNYYPQK